MSRPRRFSIPAESPSAQYDPMTFIEAHCRVDAGYETTNAELWSEYNKAATRAGLAPVAQRRLSRTLLRQGFRQAASRSAGRVWSCLLLVDVDP